LSRMHYHWSVIWQWMSFYCWAGMPRGNMLTDLLPSNGYIHHNTVPYT
jgi:hypothetical protein